MSSAVIEVVEPKSIADRVMARFRAMSLLVDYFPLTLVNEAVVDGVTAMCSRCDQPIPVGLFRGEVREAPANSYRITGIGRCLKCNLLTPYIAHIIPGLAERSYECVDLEYRGWVEAYEPKVLQFKCEPVEEEKVANTA